MSSIIYVDDKNELALNITKLSKEYVVPISNTSNFSGKLYISCSQKHDLFTGDSAVLEFNGGSQSSQVLNQQYFGYHVITKITDYDFVTDIDYGSPVLVGNDIGFVKYIKQDPFFNYQPVDIIDYGVDQKGEQSIELSIENIKLSGTKYSLIDVDYEKYRFSYFSLWFNNLGVILYGNPHDSCCCCKKSDQCQVRPTHRKTP